MRTKKRICICLICVLSLSVVFGAKAFQGSHVSQYNIPVGLGIYNFYFGDADDTLLSFGCGFSFDEIHAETDNYSCFAWVNVYDQNGFVLISPYCTQRRDYSTSRLVIGYAGIGGGIFHFEVGDCLYE